ncbi:hypothetical protein D7Y09_06780 [bacterium 1XD42-1]|nr:hypothetical protein D7X25_05405 [bacterium 1XD42-8]RKJ65245.1 hypothetical protein D7Y09_06780 [bacterium 1XD42-1]
MEMEVKNMEPNHLAKQYYLDFSNHRELCCAENDGQRVVTETPVGETVCKFLNLSSTLEKSRTRLQKLLPLNNIDPDAYIVMISVNLGHQPLPDSPYAAKLFGLLEYISQIHPIFYILMQMERLLLQMEQNAPEKTIIQHMAATAARAATLLEKALAALPEYTQRVDSVLNYTRLEPKNEEKTPVLTRAWRYQRKTGVPLEGLDALPSRTLMAQEQSRILPASADYKPVEDPILFYGESLAGKNLSQILSMLFCQMLLDNTIVRVCGVCGRYFVPQIRSNEKYCDHQEMVDGILLTCKQRSTKTRMENDPSLRLLKGAYDRNFVKAKRKKEPEYVEKIFRPWYAWAKEQRSKYLKHELTLDELSEMFTRKMENYLY